MATWRDDIGTRRARAGQGNSLARTLAAVVVFYLAAVLLNGDALHKNAEQLPFGRVRQASLQLTAPLRWISRASRLYLVREWIETVWHKENSP